MTDLDPQPLITLLRGARAIMRQAEVTPSDAQLCAKILNETLRRLNAEHGADDSRILRLLSNGETR